MNNKTNSTTNFFDNMLEAHKNMVDTMVDNTKNAVNGNPLMAGTIEQGSSFYKNWLDNQKTILNNAATNVMTENGEMKNNLEYMGKFYQHWLDSQMSLGKAMFEMNQNWFKNLADMQNTGDMNWFSIWANWMSTMLNQNSTNNWANMNPFAGHENTNGWGTFFTQYNEMLNSSFGDWTKAFRSNTTTDSFSGMFNMTKSFSKFYELWMPMLKSIQNKTFNMDVYKQFMSPEKYKEFMDKFFGFMPEPTKQFFEQMNTMMKDGMKNFTTQGLNNFGQMKNTMNNMMPWMQNPYGTMMNMYSNWYGSIENAVGPLTKLMPVNFATKTLQEWANIQNRMVEYNIKNAELQYMTYLTGSKVMDMMAENILNKMNNGEEINSMIKLYQEWLNTSDKLFAEMFESDAYCKLMTEVNAIQMKLKKDLQVQMEKMFFNNVPVATRTEMDELYKMIYDLKKQVHDLEKKNETTFVEKTEVEKPEPVKATTSRK